ncbi:hypothetical protein [Actinomadura madurae]|uniref:hypothetical protein n=1 Tax=Actinomadura madurae TaxID=1993 RepID=UPI0011BE59AE|nr:hypothetical protein [Actinomadura madurae]
MRPISFIPRTVAAAGAIGLFVTAAPASAQTSPSEAPGDTTGHRVYRDYLASPTQRTARPDQCDKPVNQRTGNWFCAPPRDQQIRQNRVHNPRLSVRDGHCEALGCWNVYSSVESNFSANGWFGYGDTTLGTVNFYYDVKLNGGQSVSKPVGFSASRNLASLVFEGERLYYSPAHPEGNPVRNGDTYNFTDKGPLPAGPTVFWTPNGYKAFEDTVQTGSVVHQATWTVSGYPGRWYIFGKSVRFHLTASSYRFGSADDLGTQPSDAAYRPA